LNDQARILRFVTRSNWILLAATTVAGLALAHVDVAQGIAAGGLIVTINFHLLARTLKKSLRPPHLAPHHRIIAKYYLRFVASGMVVFVLMAGRCVDPLGLFIGLSVVVASIFTATALEFSKLILKEAV
jgi:hypothetical protein